MNCSSEILPQNIYQGKSQTSQNIHQDLVPETVPRPKILDPFSTPQKNHQHFQTPPIKINNSDIPSRKKRNLLDLDEIIESGHTRKDRLRCRLNNVYYYNLAIQRSWREKADIQELYGIPPYTDNDMEIIYESTA